MANWDMVISGTGRSLLWGSLLGSTGVLWTHASPPDARCRTAAETTATRNWTLPELGSRAPGNLDSADFGWKEVEGPRTDLSDK